MNFNLKSFLHIFCPTRCACCSRVIFCGEQLCADCREQLPFIPDGFCPSCGRPKKKCACVKGKQLSFSYVTPFFYDGAVRSGLLTLKSGRSTHGVKYFARQMAGRVNTLLGDHFDGIAYVPVTLAKLRKRGYNQSRLLAEALGRELGLPVVEDGLVRLYDTKDQHKSPCSQRRGNVFGVFQAKGSAVRGKHLLLVDDIITTGHTLNECGKMMLLEGCAEVCCVTAASTKFEENEEQDQIPEGEQLQFSVDIF